MIQLQQISKSYKKQEILIGVNLTCQTGKIQALLTSVRCKKNVFKIEK